MTILHGSETLESPTKLPTPTPTAGLTPVVFGTAPVHLTSNQQNINTPILISSMTEFEQKFGYSDDWETYTLCEVADYFFNKKEVGPIVFVNVLDPEVNKKTGPSTTLTVTASKAKLDVADVILNTLELKKSEVTLVSGTDYEAQYDDEGKVIIAFLTPQTTVTATFSVIDETTVTNAQIIGGYDADTDKTTGIELVNKVLIRTGQIPGVLFAPKYSKNPTVAAVLRAKAVKVNGYFKVQALNDIDSSVVKKASDLAAYKEQNNYTGIQELVLWPLGMYQGKKYHLSTVAAAELLNQMNINNGFPSASISNKSIKIDRIVVQDGATYKDLELEPKQANEVNALGVVTAINFVNGITLWGNYTAAYPIEDVKDKFHNVRIMHNFIGNSIILNTWSDVDTSISKRQLESIVDKMNIWFNSLQGVGAIIGGRVEALAEDNPAEELLKGNVKIRYYVAESVPNQYIQNILEFDATYYNSLFE